MALVAPVWSIQGALWRTDDEMCGGHQVLCTIGLTEAIWAGAFCYQTHIVNSSHRSNCMVWFS